jgi:hypothetical protein
MENSVPPRRTCSVPWTTRVLSYAMILLVGVIVGFVPMWVRERAGAVDASEALASADLTRSVNALAGAEIEQDLISAALQNTLANAAIDTQRGDYEAARQSASDFYTALRKEVDKGKGTGLSPAQREAAQPFFEMRDEVITLLARSDPAATARFSDMYVSFREPVRE